MKIRKAISEDVEELIKLRLDYLRIDYGALSSKQESQIREQLTGYFSKHLNQGDFVAIFGESDGVIVSTAFLTVIEKPANLNFITGKTGSILNVLTYPEYRRHGYATHVLMELIGEARHQGIAQLDLMATEEGKLLYKKLGFTLPQYTSMRLKLL